MGFGLELTERVRARVTVTVRDRVRDRARARESNLIPRRAKDNTINDNA